MKLSIIIINYRAAAMTIDCVRSIIESGIMADYEIIVVDNDSQDGSFETMKAAGLPNTILLASPYNGGFSYGNNFGADVASGEYLFFFNNDTLLKPFVLDEMISFMECDKGCGALTCQSVNAKGDYLNNGHAFPTRMTLVKEIVVRPLVPLAVRNALRKRKQSRPQSLCVHWDWISGSGLLMRRVDYDAIGGWDESYFMYMEDVSLCQEISCLGKYCGIYNKLGFVHYLGDGMGSPKVIFEASKSEILYYRKYRPHDAKFAKTMTIERARQKCHKSCPESCQVVTDALRKL